MLNQLKEKFINPPDEFTPFPFWFWNDTLKEAEILRQISDFKDKGVMGFVIHPRLGLSADIPYLSNTFMNFVKLAVKEAHRLGMKVVLYDEAMYPSGSAHGMVVADNPEYATRALRMQEYPVGRAGTVMPKLQEGERIISAQAVLRSSDGTIDPGNIILLDVVDEQITFAAPEGDVYADWIILVFLETFSGGTIRGIHFGEDDGEPAVPASGDLLNPDAMDKFIRITYDRYYQVLKDYFGTTVMAMFTDEPDVLGRCTKSSPFLETNPKIYPWTIGFLEWYENLGGSLKDLPLLWFNGDEQALAVRKKYQRAVNKRLEESYYRKISAWCEAHGIALTGHPAASDDIGFLKHFQIPGQDIVWRYIGPENDKGITGTHSTMGKCSSDAARHAGRRHNSNECFGCCGPNGIHWAFSMDDMKWYLDWMFVRGVNLLYPHAFYYSMDGEKRFGERPPDVGLNNIWWKYYHLISDYIKRMCFLLTDSHNTADIAVLCEEDCLPWQLPAVLFQNQTDFNYLEQNLLLSDECIIENGRIRIQKQSYHVLLAEDYRMLTESVTARLAPFIKSSGQVMVYNPGKTPLPFREWTEFKDLEAIGRQLMFTNPPELRLLPVSKNLRCSHVVKAGVDFYILVNEGEEVIRGELRLTKIGAVQAWHPWEGTVTDISRVYSENGQLCLPLCLNRRESLILCLDTSKKASFKEEKCSEPAREYSGEVSNLFLGGPWYAAGIRGDERQEIKLESWTNWADMEDFTGTVVYSTEFSMDDSFTDRHFLLDLGQVHELARLTVNNQIVGVRMWAPYHFDITAYVRSGINSLKLEIDNSMANRLSHAKLPSGLLGPVILKRMK